MGNDTWCWLLLFEVDCRLLLDVDGWLLFDGWMLFDFDGWLLFEVDGWLSGELSVCILRFQSRDFLLEISDFQIVVKQNKIRLICIK